MALDSSLMLCAVSIGVAQVLDCCLLRAGKSQGRTAIAFSAIEWIWGALCVYLLLNRSDEFPLWLAGTFVAQLAAWTLYVIAQMRQGRPAEAFELSGSEALIGGLFGAFYATASLITWVGLGT